MVQRLLTFIEASRTRNWLLHISSAEEITKDIIYMDRIKYRKAMPVFIAEMRNLEHTHPQVWKYIMEGFFSVQKSSITGVAIGCDHAGEQVNRESKSRGGLKGITMSANSRNRQYIASPILDQWSKRCSRNRTQYTL